MRTLLLLSALPGSGKTTWAKQYQKTHPHTFIVSSDDIRVEFFGKAQNFSNEPKVWSTFLDRLNGYSQKFDDVNVIADATNLQNKYRVMYTKLTPFFDKHILVLFDVPYEVCCFQNKLRSKDLIVTDEAMELLRKEYEEPTPEVLKLFDSVIVVKNFLSKQAQAEEAKGDLKI
jgi:predicted kinase